MQLDLETQPPERKEVRLAEALDRIKRGSITALISAVITLM